MVFCTQCGNKCDDSFRFCNGCGAPLQQAAAAAAAPAPAPAAAPAAKPETELAPGDKVTTIGGIQIITHGPQKTGLVCAACHEAITNESFAISALGKKFHKECFKCARCGQRLFSFAKFFEDENGMPLCARCNSQDMPHCAGCGKPIMGKYIVAANKSYHPDCCRCAGCGQPFGPEGFFEDGGKLWHLNCAQN